MKFVLQWHITGRCNFRCIHCYQDEYSSFGPSLDELKKIFFQYLEINSDFFGNDINKRYINFIGGEPLLRDDFKDLLCFINQVSPYVLNIGILSNGSLLTEDFLLNVRKLEKLNIYFQFSIEGPRETNDMIRGIGTYEKILSAMNLCRIYNINYHLSFTLTKLNYKKVYELVPLVEEYGIKLKIRRFIPNGTGKSFKKYFLSAREWFIFSINIFKLNAKLKKGMFDLSGCSEVTGYAYNGNYCAINEHRLLVINHDLEVFPCKRLEISLGNLKDKTLKELYFSSTYKSLINSYKEIVECKICSEYLKCKGGAKCIIYSMENTLKKADPQCYKKKYLVN